MKDLKQDVLLILERKKCQGSYNKSNCYAKRFAAKEATSKALGTGINKGISWKQIEVESLKSESLL